MPPDASTSRSTSPLLGQRLHHLWRQQTCALNGWLAIPSTVTAEIVAHQDYDSITVDLQHGLLDYQSALALMQTVHGHGKTVLARVPWNEPGIIGKMLDAGALGIICPMVNTAAEAERFVGACQYPPRGYRSSGPTRPRIIHPGYHQTANETVITLAMIETRQGFENLDAILETTGLSGVYIGPSDLAVSMGFPPGMDREEGALAETIETIRAKTKAKGLRCAMHCLNPPFMARAAQAGFDLLSLSTDVRLFCDIEAARVSEFRELVEAQ